MREISRIFGVDETLLRRTISDVLIKARTNKELSQQQLGNMADIDRSYISEIERGLRTPTLYTLFRLAKVLEIEPSILVEQIQNGFDWKK